jgi:urease accessory protein
MKKVLDIETVFKAGSTLLRTSYAAHPYKIADITEDKAGSLLELMIMSSSPGVLDEDHYQMHVHVGTGSSLSLKTQSYQRLFCMKAGASQRMHIHVEAGASLSFLPHPVVPHAGSCYAARNDIFLAQDAQLKWGEVVTCGRKLNAEEFLFNSFQSLTEIYLNEKLAVRDNLVMKPAVTNVHSTGLLEDYTHQASLFIIDARMNTQLVVAAMHEWLSVQPDICFGASALPVAGVVVRILGGKAELLHTLLQSIATMRFGCYTAIDASHEINQMGYVT